MAEEQQEMPYMPRYQRPQQSSILQEHLDATQLLTYIRKTIEGYEQNDDGKWVKTQIIVGYDEEGKEILEDESPLMEQKYVRTIISYLYTFLNSNTFLSRNDSDMIGDIMIDVNWKLNCLFYRLRHKIPSEIRYIMLSTIEYSILNALNRSYEHITLKAGTQMQQSIEHIEKSQQMPPTDQGKDFKLLGL